MEKILIASLILACSTSAYGTLLLGENFNDLELGALNGQNGWSAVSEATVVNGALDYSKGSIRVAGSSKHAQWAGANVHDVVSKTFDSQSGDVWFSFTMRVGQTNLNNRFWFYVSDSANLSNSGVVGQIQTGSTGFHSGYRVNTSQFSSSPVSMPTGTVLVVGKLSKSASGGGNYDRMEMWIDPESTVLGAGIVAQNTIGFNVSIDTFGIAALGGGSTVHWGNLLIGTDQASVLDVYQIPEPATFTSIVGGLALACVCLKRRYRAKK